MTRVLVVDDEPQILRALRINLRVRHYEVYTAATGTEALEVAGRHPPDLVILDLGLPDLGGVEVIQGLRGWTSAPIVVLSGRADSADKVEALDAGADDYVTKPFSVDELLARMRAAARRSSPVEEQPRIRLGSLVVDLAAKRVERQVPVTASPSAAAAAPGDPGHPPEAGDIRLTPTEWHLLEVLLRHPGKLLSHQQLLTEVWGPGYAKRHREPAPVHGSAAPEAGARPGPPPVADHRAGDGLPVPARRRGRPAGRRLSRPRLSPRPPRPSSWPAGSPGGRPPRSTCRA